MSDPTGEVTELIQQLIRNRCVNDGTLASGDEVRSVDTLTQFLSGAEVQTYEPFPGRGSLVAKIEGSDPGAPSLCLMGHLDVVPVNEDRWERDPFGGELVDGVVWGRGAVDMLNTTSSMAVAFKRLVESGFKPKGDLVYFACADEEALGLHGAKWFTENETETVKTDYLLTEFGGMRFPIGAGGAPALPVMVGEKGTYWCKLRIKGTPGHASMPFRTDNALVKAAEIVRRLDAYRPKTQIHDVWRRFVESLGLPEEMTATLLDGAKLDAALAEMPLGLSRMLHACTHTTIAPTILHGGVKTNIIPDTVDLQLDIRTLPGERGDDTRAMIREALGDMADDAEILEDNPFESDASPMDTPLWDALNEVTQTLVPNSRTIPFLIVGATDARYFRKIGTTSYGYGLLSEKIPFNDFAQMFHGDNERVDQESLRLSTELWERTARAFLG
jgi:acetylornithine deacetylase/succinyl-diaminopimelate desuccinylase-like protein